MKRILSVLCLVALCLTMLVPALAEQPQLATTQAFIELLEMQGLNYTYRGADDNGKERVTIGLQNDACSYTMTCIFDSDMETVSIYVWNLIEFEGSNSINLYRACNTENYDWKIVKFYVDTTDNTVTAQYDLIFHYTAAAKSAFQNSIWDAMVRMDGILEEAYPSFAPYAK